MADLPLAGSLAGCRVFIAEDEPLIGMLLEDFLEEAGCSVVGPFTTKAEALAAVETAEIDVALLDINLQGGKVYPVAEVLEARKVPFLLLTGYDADDGLDGHDWPLFGKPFHGTQLITRLQELLGTVEA